MAKKLPMSVSEIAAALGRLGGIVSTPAKADAARENGKLGGRPRKKAKKSEARK
jgi:hypothetical protein